MTLEDRLYQSAPAWLRTVFLNLHAKRVELHRYGAPYLRHVETMERLARSSVEDVRRYQNERLGRVLEVAYNQTAFYRQLWDDAGVRPSDIRGVEDLQRLPLTRKEPLRAAGDAATTEKAPRRGWLVGRTSGTTGSPLTLWYDRETCRVNNAAERLQKIWAGVPRDAWIALFLGRVITPVNVKRPPFWHANHVLRQVWFSSFHLTDANIDLYIDEIRRRKLRYVEGYPSTLFILAQRVLALGQTLPMDAVFSSSETMHQIQRDAIAAAFGAPIFDYFGHAERAAFAIECEHHDGKHVVEPYGYVEIVDESGRNVPDGEMGFITATSLHNVAMPMIRYVTSDISAIETTECRCGRSFRRIKNVSTKAEDIVVLPDGRWLSPSVLTHPFKPFPQIAKSQIVQERADSLRVRVVAGDAFTESMQQALVAGIRERTGDDVQVVVEVVADIPREASGKYRWVVSKVPHNLRVRWQGE